jgi:hypothetical protein
VYDAKGNIFNNMLHVQHVNLTKDGAYSWDKPIFSSGRLLNKDYSYKGSIEKIFGRGPQGTWHQDELIGSKPPLLK